jgi:hypothetical protein
MGLEEGTEGGLGGPTQGSGGGSEGVLWGAQGGLEGRLWDGSGGFEGELSGLGSPRLWPTGQCGDVVLRVMPVLLEVVVLVVVAAVREVAVPVTVPEACTRIV